MGLGKFDIAVTDNKIAQIYNHVSDEKIQSIRQLCERYGKDDDEIRLYDVYQITTSSGNRILKKTHTREAFIYENYLQQKNFSVPHYYGSWNDGNEVWILLEHVTGTDLRDMTDSLALTAADTLAQIQNFYWKQNPDGNLEYSHYKSGDRFEQYWHRILQRQKSIADNPLLHQAYQLFLERQLTCPCTLSHGDFMQFNLIQTNGQVTIIDWGFGGEMPYSLDIARFIAHATETRSTFPFYMNQTQKHLFLNTVYHKLTKKPDYEQFLNDIKLALLNEYIEFVEAEEDEDHWYLDHALELAKDILAS